MKAPSHIARAARGMAAIAAAAGSSSEMAALAYIALYACGYGRGPLERFARLDLPAVDVGFVRRLFKRVPDRVLLDDWKATSWDRSRVFLEKDGVRVFCPRSAIRSKQLASGRRAQVSVPVLLPGKAPGFVVRPGGKAIRDRPVSRFYLNIRPAAAAWALGPLARAVDDAGCPFLIKVLAHPRAYYRRDACVLYVESRQVGVIFNVIRQRIKESKILLRPPVPLFTGKLAPGVGFADDPSDRGAGGLSHGRWVSGLFVAAAANSANPVQIAQDVAAALSAEGRDPRRPFLRPGRSALEMEVFQRRVGTPSG